MANAIVLGFDRAQTDQLGDLLRQGGHVVLRLQPDCPALETVRIQRPDLCLIRHDAAGGWGEELCRQFRSDQVVGNVAIVMISETNDEESELSAFTAGADSYVFHPIRCRAFLARIQAILRRPRPAISQPAGLAVEGQSYAVRADGRLVTLTFYEFHVVDAMARNSGRVMSRDDIVSLVWGGGDATSPRLVDIYVQRLRQKLGVYASHIETVRGVGYRFSDSGLEMAKANGMTVQRADPSHDQRAPCR